MHLDRGTVILSSDVHSVASARRMQAWYDLPLGKFSDPELDRILENAFLKIIKRVYSGGEKPLLRYRSNLAPGHSGSHEGG